MKQSLLSLFIAAFFFTSTASMYTDEKHRDHPKLKEKSEIGARGRGEEARHGRSVSGSQRLPSPSRQAGPFSKESRVTRQEENQRFPYQHRYYTPRSPSMSRSQTEPNPTRSSRPRQSGHTHMYDQNELRRNTQNFKSNFHEKQKHFHDANQNASSHIKTRYPDYKTWFNDRYYHHHHHRPNYWRNTIDWWGWTPWNGIYSWLGWGGDIYPYYYYDGYPIQMDAEWPGYADSLQPSYTTSSIQGDWLPLGVFILGSDISEVKNSDIFIQLAVNRDGSLSGIYYNITTDQSFPISGYVDASTQEAFWEVPGQASAPKMAAGIYNLTQNVASVQLEFPSGVTQNWFLIRVSE